MLRPLLFVLLAGCVTENALPTTMSTKLCARSIECDKSTFEQVYSDKRDCIETTEADLQTIQDCLVDAGCSYDPDFARECVQAINDASCVEVTSGEWLGQCIVLGERYAGYSCSLGAVAQAATCGFFQ